MFSRNPLHRYVPETTTWPEFRDGSNGMLHFHAVQLPPPALRTEIELFAARLDGWMLDFGWGGTEGARAAIRAALGPPAGTLSELLTAIDDNYRDEGEP